MARTVLPHEPDAKGAIEEDFVRIECIDGYEVLGYRGEGREEHSGENSPLALEDQLAELADNLPEDILDDILDEDLVLV